MSLALEDVCRKLRLAYVPKAAKEAGNPDGTMFLQNILEAELARRHNAKLQRLLSRAGFPQMKTLDGYSFETLSFPGSCNLEKLLSLDFIRRQENVLMLGAVGTGKTHLAISLGVEACRQGYGVRFFRVADLVSLLQQKYAEGRIGAFRKELAKNDCLILDELGYVPFHETGSELLFHVIADCYEKQSVIVTSNLEFGQWNSIFGDTRLTAALVDRLVHHAHILTFTGESYRLRHALSVMQS